MVTRAVAKTTRMLDALEHRSPDRVPIGEFFWADFVDRCRGELGAGSDFDPHRYWDLDYVVLTPNLDPRISGVRVLEEASDRRL